MRAIDADALIEFIENRYDITWKCDYEGGIKDACTDILEKISKMPTIEPEIIRCKDCKYWQDQQEGVVEVPICIRPENKYEQFPFRFIIGEDGFCSFAERRTDERSD